MGWWGNWRQTAPAHIGNLQATDLLDCTSIIGGVEVNNTITGAQIIAAASGGGAVWGGITGLLPAQTDLQSALNAKQDTLVSGTNIKTVNGNSLVGSGNVTIAGASPYTTVGNSAGILVNNSTANTISASILIPGNTLVATQVLQLRAQVRKIGGSGTVNVRFYINTTNTLVGATQIGQAQNMTGAGQMQRVMRDFYITISSLQCYLPTNPISTDVSSGAMTNVTYTLANAYYLIAAIQCSTLLEDGTITRLNLMTY
jgi:hypothetical protein